MTGVSKYNAEDAATICEALADGHSLLSICEAMGVPFSTAMLWEKSHPDHAENAARARELGCRAMAEQMLSIADTTQVGTIRTTKPDGTVEEREEDMTQHRRLQIETRKWLLSKWASKLYGDRLELGGSINVKKSAADMTDEELALIATGKKSAANG